MNTVSQAYQILLAHSKAEISAVPDAAEPDHEQIAHAIQVAIYRAMTPQQLFLQALRMDRTMRALFAAGYRFRHPGWTEPQVQRAVAERILSARCD